MRISKGVKNIRIVITAGPTYEPIDPVRGITNRSTGDMGYAIADEAIRRGYKVTLITGPVANKPTLKAKKVNVITAIDMKTAVLRHATKNTCLVMAAAVSDFRVKTTRRHKIKKQGKGLILQLTQNPDILQAVSKIQMRMKVGFALESNNVVQNAKKKLFDKHLDLIVANRISNTAIPFGGGKKDFIILSRKEAPRQFKNYTKKQMAGVILDAVKMHTL